MNYITAIAVFDEPRVKGVIHFHQYYGEDLTTVSFDLHSLPPNEVRAVHIHEYGDTRKGCQSLGAHWNPEGTRHGSISIDINDSHAGDLINNLQADSNGNFRFQYKDPRITLFGSVRISIIGRSVVIHDKSDDLGLGCNKESKITGNAGGRMACAIIAHSKN